MPEIAEVETVRNILKKEILHKKIKEVTVIYKKMIENNDVTKFERDLINQEFIDILRRGKWLIFETNDFYLVSHLRMEGRYYYKLSSDEVLKHEHVLFTFIDGSELRYFDSRKFGVMKLINKNELSEYPGIKKQGIEPIDDNLSGKYLFNKIKKKNMAIKTVLLDQTIISGLGNIYVDEVLFASNIKPTRKALKITQKECDNIVKNAKEIITKAIKYGGTTVHSFESALGKSGDYQSHLLVYGRAKKPCIKCGMIIKKIKVNGRGTSYCPKCQK